jgi:hypothetical protein
VHDTTLLQLHGIQVRRRNFRLRGILALLVLATTVPLGLFAGLLIAMSSQQQRAVVDRQNVDTARAISIAIDKEVESATDVLAVLASVEDLLRRDIQSFRTFALRLIPRQPGWHAVLLADPSNRVLMNTADTDRQHPAAPIQDWAAAAIRSARPTVSDLFVDPDTGRYFVIVSVPVIEARQAPLCGWRADTIYRVQRSAEKAERSSQRRGHADRSYAAYRRAHTRRGQVRRPNAVGGFSQCRAAHE